MFLATSILIEVNAWFNWKYSVRLDDNNILVTPSGSSFGRLDLTK